MRKFSFVHLPFKPAQDAPADPQAKAPVPPPKKLGAYRTIISRHEAMEKRLQNEPSAPVEDR